MTSRKTTDQQSHSQRARSCLALRLGFRLGFDSCLGLCLDLPEQQQEATLQNHYLWQTEEIQTEGHTSRNLSSLPGQLRPEDRIRQRTSKNTHGFLSLRRKVSFEKELKKNQPVGATEPHAAVRLASVAVTPAQLLRLLHVCLSRTMEKDMQWSIPSWEPRGATENKNKQSLRNDKVKRRQCATTSDLTLLSSARLRHVARKQGSWRTVSAALISKHRHNCQKRLELHKTSSVQTCHVFTRQRQGQQTRNSWQHATLR